VVLSGQAENSGITGVPDVRAFLQEKNFSTRNSDTVVGGSRMPRERIGLEGKRLRLPFFKD
jgi:hypothetical protein